MSVLSGSKKYLLVLAVFACLTAGIYGGTAGYPFQFDDGPAVADNPNIQSPSSIIHLFTNTGLTTSAYTRGAAYRPLFY
jgi:hypothetical protein